MKELSNHSSFIQYDHIDEIKEEYRLLLAKTEEALEVAYAPYSNFKVGSALLLENGNIILGANQENASYPLCMCAERVALYNASIHFPSQSIIALSVTARGPENQFLDPIPPCGACRQVIAEYEYRQKKTIDLLLKGTTSKIWHYTGINDLLPISFSGNYLP